MNKITKKDSFWALAALFALILLVQVLMSGSVQQAVAGEGGRDASACTIQTTASVSIGPDISTQITNTYSNNAYVIIQQPVFATSTVYLNFGDTASATSGFHLAPGLASTTPDSFEFGRNTNFPFTGYVEALSVNGSTTLNIIECRY